MVFNLPNPATNAGLNFIVKDIAGQFGSSGCTLHRFGTETFEGLAADYVINANFAAIRIFCDGTNWWIIG